MGDLKWIPDLANTTPLDIAARQTLGLRLKAVLVHIEPACNSPHEDPEHIHQLRVATRRARAALDLFGETIPSKSCERLRRALRRIRRVAGPARDWDVFMGALAPRLLQEGERTALGLHWVAGQAAARRQTAQEELVARGPELLDDLQTATSDILDHLQHPRALPLLGSAAAARLQTLLSELDVCTSGDLDDEAQLHRVRIAGKRVRYAIEILADCFPSRLREMIYPRIEEMQDHLGKINDAHVAMESLKAMREHAQQFHPELWPGWRPGVESLLRTCRQRMQAERKRFHRFWQHWCEERIARRFRELLSSEQRRRAIS